MTLTHILFLLLGILLIVAGAVTLPTRYWPWPVLDIVAGVVFVLAAFNVLT